MARFYSNFLSFTLLLALVVIVLGAYTRLADAGLGCPDWPGCYGHLTVPEDTSQSGFDRPLEPAKAWAEMIHRYVAGTLGIVILIAFLFAVFKREVRERVGVIMPFLLLCTVVFQALLGMWTVTKLLSPVIVTAHLIGGFTTLSLLWIIWLRSRRDPAAKYPTVIVSGGIKLLGMLALLAVIAQIVLGGWTSTNYAAIACGTSFPTCHGSLWPAADFAQGFSLGQQMQEGVDYEYGILESPARTAIHITHRAGAIVVLILVGLLSLSLLMAKRDAFGGLAKMMLLLLTGQITLGILNVVMALPIGIATAHNLVAALLLLLLIAVNYRFITEH
ncbi:MAG: COX15/CtaA family protein [Thiolinea sp.]